MQTKRSDFIAPTSCHKSVVFLLGEEPWQEAGIVECLGPAFVADAAEFDIVDFGAGGFQCFVCLAATYRGHFFVAITMKNHEFDVTGFREPVGIDGPADRHSRRE